MSGAPSGEGSGSALSSGCRMSKRLTVAGIEVSPDHFIGGERVASGRAFTDLSPIDEQPLGEIARGGEREAERAVAAATEAFPSWAGLGPRGRAAHLHRLADLIDANVDRLAAVECVDMAMLLRSLRARLINRGARNYRSLRRSRGRLRGARVATRTAHTTASSACRAARRW